MTSDQQETGFISQSFFEEKEGAYYAFIRNSGTVPASLSEYALRSLNGLATSSNVSVAGSLTTISFATSINIGNIISIGDMVYFGNPTPQLAGQVTAVNQNLPAGLNDIVINNNGNTFIPVVVPTPTTVTLPSMKRFSRWVISAIPGLLNPVFPIWMSWGRSLEIRRKIHGSGWLQPVHSPGSVSLPRCITWRS